ncbi:hypothetical protein QR680_014008 [Steinernema hermaphroditum]|uniref:Uncharacterized protein n=1 Tax=Steinernema hermaphroditum TaxID=289476 RepID=A0AA39I7E6_9BILA|nr:hypothetical protein QR680_014008 [Steinernema hermaphroditum]
MTSTTPNAKPGYKGIYDHDLVFKEFMKMRARMRSEALRIDISFFRQLENLVNYVDPLTHVKEGTYVLIDNVESLKKEAIIDEAFEEAASKC